MAAGRTDQVEQDADTGGFPGTVGSQEPEQFTLRDRQVDPPQRMSSAVALRQSSKFDRCGGGQI